MAWLVCTDEVLGYYCSEEKGSDVTRNARVSGPK